MKTLSVCFFGHRNIGCFSRVGELVEQTIESLLRQNEFVEFLVGREGDFDQICIFRNRKGKTRLRN